ncbi:citrate lyase acyl carrier protein [candidate division TA06 bacterium]|uniref:Citrate lyase acyl carrier protein n=1 Tax=candidate division TA06 bacterium TaxID=2250710 RepID=A0A660S7K5_UNCT6|nr:MAG: citrate lyase acyl carrier protein [candidate division TA06 bacterium]
MDKIGTAGNKGKSVRSDCFVTLEITESKGISIDIKSKVGKLFGDSISKLCEDELSYFGIENAKLTVEDTGALPFVLMARIEAAIKKVIQTDKQYVPKMLPENVYQTERDRFRRSRLYLPGNTPKLMLNAGIHKPDGIILDLEDSVAPDKKEEAKILVRNALCQINFYGAERMVRINQIPSGLDDLEYVVPYNVNLILIPKCENGDQVLLVDKKIMEIKAEKGIDYPIYLMPIIESAKGVINAYEIATSSKNVVAMAIGLEDYTADIGAPRSKEGKESFFARSQLVNSARAAGIQPIDSVFSDVSDMDALREVVIESKSLGFDGMGCIHPRQIKVIHEAFAPTEAEIEKAKKIVNAFIEANEKGLGVVSVGSKMIDPPVVKRAQRVIELAISTGKLSENWRDDNGE